MQKNIKKRVVITSIGVISSLGSSLNQIIDNIKKEKVSFKTFAFDKSVCVCPVDDFDLKKITGRLKNARYLSRGARLCVASAIMAINNSGLLKNTVGENLLYKSGLFTGTGPNFDIGGELSGITNGIIDPENLSALWILKFLPNTATSVISEFTGIHGENLTINTACSASMQAIGEAYRKINNGYLDLALAGGGDSRLSQGGILAYKKAQTLCISNHNSAKEACRPFDKNRNGFMPGEGGAFFLLEELDHALKRGAEIHCEICGFGASIDGYNMTAPEPEGRWAKKAVISALNEAEVSASDIDVVSAHGTGTLLNDVMESILIDNIFMQNKPIIIAIKSWIGHLSAACGASELAVCLSCMKHGYIPKIRNLVDSCKPGLNFALKTKKTSFNTLLMQNFGFGGQNAALVIKSWKK